MIALKLAAISIAESLRIAHLDSVHKSVEELQGRRMTPFYWFLATTNLTLGQNFYTGAILAQIENRPGRVPMGARITKFGTWVGLMGPYIPTKF